MEILHKIFKDDVMNMFRMISFIKKRPDEGLLNVRNVSLKVFLTVV